MQHENKIERDKNDDEINYDDTTKSININDVACKKLYKINISYQYKYNR